MSATDWMFYTFPSWIQFHIRMNSISSCRLSICIWLCVVLEVWKGRGEGCTVTILTTLPWSQHVSAQLLEGHPPTGRWSLLLRTKWPSKLHAAPRTCAAVTRTHCCPLSRSSAAPARSALKCKACAVDRPLGCTHSFSHQQARSMARPGNLHSKRASETFSIEATLF